MKLFFMSDIHGSLFYLKEAIERFEKEGASHIIILGDELYHGPRNPLPQDYNPKEVADILNTYAEKIIAVRGNCDSEVDDMVLSYPIMSTYCYVLYEGRKLFLTHGHVYNDSNLPPLSPRDVFFFGHTHIPMAEKKNGITVINPGSISLPKENNPHTYGILENNIFLIKQLDGSVFKQIEI